MSKELVVLVGNIGTGKSTVARKYQKKGYVVVARDGLRYSIGGGNYIFDPKYEPVIWEIELCMLESFMELGVNIVIDEVGVSKSIRMRYIVPGQDYGYTIKCHILPKLTMKEAVDRRMKDPHGQPNRKLWEEIWQKFHRMYEEPNLEEGFDEIIREVT
jgi:predicted kinase